MLCEAANHHSERASVVSFPLKEEMDLGSLLDDSTLPLDGSLPLVGSLESYLFDDAVLPKTEACELDFGSLGTNSESDFPQEYDSLVFEDEMKPKVEYLSDCKPDLDIYHHEIQPQEAHSSMRMQLKVPKQKKLISSTKRKLRPYNEYLSSSSHTRIYSNFKSNPYGSVNERGQRVLPPHLQTKSRPREEFQRRQSPASRTGRSDSERLEENEKERARRRELREKIIQVADLVPSPYRQQNNSQKECRLDSLQNVDRYLQHICRLWARDVELNKLDMDLGTLPSNSA